jgi:hypothetical protein
MTLREKRIRKLEEEALDHTVWRNSFEGGCGSNVRQTTELM